MKSLFGQSSATIRGFTNSWLSNLYFVKSELNIYSLKVHNSFPRFGLQMSLRIL